MKNILYMTMLAALLFACKPAAYVGPLDSPIGNWQQAGCDFYFNGENVGDADSSYYSAMTFYKEGLICIEGVKGAFPYNYDPQTHILQIDSTSWAVQTLHSEEMVLKYLGRIYPTPPSEDGTVKSDEGNEGDTDEEVTESEGNDGEGTPEEDLGPKPDKNGIILPAGYKGFSIDADENSYYYINATGNKIYCIPVGQINAEGLMDIALWYDTRTDYYEPLVVVIEKK